jgi:hypothetical protein
LKRLWGCVKGLLSGGDSKATDGDDPAKSDAKAKAEPKSASEQIAAGMEEIRTLLRRMGAALGAAATAILAGLGWAQVHETFPLPEGKSWLLIPGAVASIAAFGGAAWLAARFFAAQRRIVIASDESAGEDFEDKEKDARDAVFQLHSLEEVAPSVYAMELRAYRLQRLARELSSDDLRKKKLESEGNRLLDLVDLALSQAALWILEIRSKRAFTGGGTFLALALTVLGIVGLFGIADYAKGQRDLIDLRAKCQDALNKGAVDACDPVRSSASKLTAKQKAAAAKKKAENELKDATTILTGDAPTTVADKIKWLNACVIVLGVTDAVPDAEPPPDLVAACSSLIPPPPPAEGQGSNG